MIPHPGQHGRVQHLEQQSRNPAHHHGGDVAVDPPGDSAWAEQPLLRSHLASPRAAAPRSLIERGDHLGGDGLLGELRDRVREGGWECKHGAACHQLHGQSAPERS